MEIKFDSAQRGAGTAHTAEFANRHVADVVDTLNRLPNAVGADLLLRLPRDRVTDLFDQTGLERAGELIQLLPRPLAAELLEAMSADRRADIFRDISFAVRNDFLQRLRPETQADVLELMGYPEGTAGALMTTEFVSVLATATVGQALHYIRVVERTRETVYSVFVLDSETKSLLAAVSLRQLIAGNPSASVLSLSPPRPTVTVEPLTDQEEVARLIRKYDLLAVPVVNDTSQVLGIVTVDDILGAIIAEGTEDAQKFGGSEPLDKPYMAIRFPAMLSKRAGWLCILFLAEMLTSWAMQYFQAELEKAIVLALFIPLVMSSGGNSGSQATSLIIRALALREVELRDWWRVALRELPTGAVLGAILGLIAIARIAVWQWFGLFDYGPQWPRIALAIGAALVGIVCFGSLSGAMLPFMLKRIGFDPATASAPFVATLVDVGGLVIYFSVALFFLRGTLL